MESVVDYIVAPKDRIGWRWLLAVFAVAFAVYAVSPVRQNYDSYLAFPTAQSVVHDSNLTLNEFNTPLFETHGWMTVTETGKEINTYPWVPSLMLVPAVIGLDVGHAVGIGPGSYAVANGGRGMDTIQQLSASVVVALVVVIVFAISFRRLSPTQSIKRRRAIAGRKSSPIRMCREVSPRILRRSSCVMAHHAAFLRMGIMAARVASGRPGATCLASSCSVSARVA